MELTFLTRLGMTFLTRLGITNNISLHGGLVITCPKKFLGKFKAIGMCPTNAIVDFGECLFELF